MSSERYCHTPGVVVVIVVVIVVVDNFRLKFLFIDLMLRFNPKWDMHWLRTKQNREWFASKACSQNSGFSFGSF